MSKLIIPILNSSARLLPGPTHYLADKIRIESLSNEDYGLVSKTDPEYASRFKPEHRCIFIDLDNGVNVQSEAARAASRLRYVLNNFMNDHPLLLEFAVHAEKVGRRNVYANPTPINFGEDFGTLKKTKTPFQIKAGTKREDITRFYGVVNEACLKHRRLYLTIAKFNSALTREKHVDRIIDVTISLESLVQDDKNELSFKFALYNAFAGVKDAEKRMDAFELLKQLYSTRSSIVHGASDEAKEQCLVAAIQEKWGDIEELTRRIINEFVFFAKDGDPKGWTAHLLRQIISAPGPVST